MDFAIGIFGECPMTLVTLSILGGAGPGDLYLYLVGGLAVVKPGGESGRGNQKYCQPLPTGESAKRPLPPPLLALGHVINRGK